MAGLPKKALVNFADEVAEASVVQDSDQYLRQIIVEF